VVLDAAGLDGAAMQRIARETNFSETTFLTADAPRDGGWDVRIFTPLAEVPFAGHPTLGTAHVIRQALQAQPAPRVVLNLQVGPIAVTADRSEPGDEVLWMRQRRPTFGETLPLDVAARLLRLPPAAFDPRFPVQAVSTGLPFWIAPLRDIEQVRRARADVEAFESLFARHETKMMLFFAPGAVDAGNDLHARMFAHLYGVAEDPATGSANGCLAGWLAHHRYFGGASVDARVEQGYEMGRPSLLRLRARSDDAGITIDVGGRAITVARGELL
jgi:trans-2,3-dihydro-3-hydroxyanthranilate isomerase